ncbi:MAG: hypothetical protein Q9188_005998 [Gyalolechia gomerana]
MNLYASSSPARLHIIFPATVFTDSYEAGDRVKSDLTKEVAENDRGQAAAEVARRSIAGLERVPVSGKSDLQLQGEEMGQGTRRTRDEETWMQNVNDLKD